jgi:hypothetical protein
MEEDTRGYCVPQELLAVLSDERLISAQPVSMCKPPNQIEPAATFTAFLIAVLVGAKRSGRQSPGTDCHAARHSRSWTGSSLLDGLEDSSRIVKVNEHDGFPPCSHAKVERESQLEGVLEAPHRAPPARADRTHCEKPGLIVDVLVRVQYISNPVQIRARNLFERCGRLLRYLPTVRGER